MTALNEYSEIEVRITVYLCYSSKLRSLLIRKYTNSTDEYTLILPYCLFVTLGLLTEDEGDSLAEILEKDPRTWDALEQIIPHSWDRHNGHDLLLQFIKAFSV